MILFITVTSNCNLNCYGCMMGCFKNDLFNYQIDKDILSNNLKILQEKTDLISEIVLTGGEPLLHPNIKEICTIIKTIYPNLPLTIFTNGISISSFTKSDFLFFSNLNIDFSISFYPDKILYNSIKSNIHLLKKNKCKVMEEEKSRPLFFKNGIVKNKHNSNKMQQIFQSCESYLDQNVYMYEDKLIKCPTCILLQKEKIINSFGLLISSIQNNKDILNFIQTPSSCCYHCNPSNFIIWHKQSELNNNTDWYLTLSDIFINDYKKYQILQDDHEKILFCLNNSNFILSQKFQHNEDQWKVLLNRYSTGLKDIGIIINNYNNIDENNLYKLKKYILTLKNWEKINFYFICINLSEEQEKLIYSYFTNIYQLSSIKSYFIKNNNLILGTLYFYENSFIKIKELINFERIYNLNG